MKTSIESATRRKCLDVGLRLEQVSRLRQRRSTGVFQRRIDRSSVRISNAESMSAPACCSCSTTSLMESASKGSSAERSLSRFADLVHHGDGFHDIGERNETRRWVYLQRYTAGGFEKIL